MKPFTLLATALLAVSATAAQTEIGDKPQVAFTVEDDLSVPGANPLTYCAKPDDYILSIKDVDLNPNPPAAGKSLNITASGILAHDIEKGAKIRISVKYGLIQILTQEADLCEQAENLKMECPIKKGDVSLTKSVDLPKQIPPGKYTVLADVTTKDQDTITCLTATVLFKTGGMSLFDL